MLLQLVGALKRLGAHSARKRALIGLRGEVNLRERGDAWLGYSCPGTASGTRAKGTQNSLLVFVKGRVEVVRKLGRATLPCSPS